LSAARRPAHAGALGLALGVVLGGCRGDTYTIGTNCVGSGSGEALQQAIDATMNGPSKTVLLCPRAEIVLDVTLSLAGGLRLLTAGLPTDPAQMATIRLAPTFPPTTRTIETSGGDIQLEAVRFDGNRRKLGPHDAQALVELGPGDGYVVDGCVFTDSPGWTHLHLIERCSSSTITNNTVESFPGAPPLTHDDTGHWTDGLSISCSDSLVASNHVNDVSAVGIVYFGGPNTTIRDNVVTETTTSAFSGINVGDAIVPDNTGVVVQDNRLVAVGPRYFHTGLAAGLHILDKTTMVTDVTFLGNTFDGIARYGLAVDGCTGCTIQDNDVTASHPLPPLPSCPASTGYVANVTGGGATGSLQSGYVDAKLAGCEGEAEVLGPVYRTYAGSTQNFPDYLAFEVQVYSQRLEQQLDADALLHTEWDAVQARAKALCPATATAADVQSVWRAVMAAEFGDKLAPADADAKVRADLAASPAGTPCGP
jgi:hypothetical protein